VIWFFSANGLPSAAKSLRALTGAAGGRQIPDAADASAEPAFDDKEVAAGDHSGHHKEGHLRQGEGQGLSARFMRTGRPPPPR